MSVERAILIFAGCMILLSLALTWWVHPYWVAFTIFVALNMIQSAFTGFCPAISVMRKLGMRSESEIARRQDQEAQSA